GVAEPGKGIKGIKGINACASPSLMPLLGSPCFLPIPCGRQFEAVQSSQSATDAASDGVGWYMAQRTAMRGRQYLALGVAVLAFAAPALLPGTAQVGDKKPDLKLNQVRLNGHTFTLPP